MFNWNKKEKPFVSYLGMGGGGLGLLGGAAGGGGSYLISRSVRFDGSTSSPTMTKTTGGSDGNRKTFTFACWAKKSSIDEHYEDLLSAYNVSDQFRFIWEPNGNLEAYSRVGGTTTFHIDTNDRFRDCSAWYHIMLAVDLTQGSASNRVKMYVNGSQITSLTTHTAAIDSNTNINRASTAHVIGKSGDSSHFDGYLADVHLVEGLQLDPSSFTETDDDGILQPKEYTGSHGSNGWWLKFTDGSSASALGTDSSGNGNNLTVSGFTRSAGVDDDWMLDSPSMYLDDDGSIRGNYCTLDANYTGDAAENGGVDNTALLKNGNLIHKSAGNWTGSVGTFAIPTTGKWYWEVECRGTNTNMGIGTRVSRLHNTIRDSNESRTVFYSFNGNIYYGEPSSWNQSATSSVNTYTTGDHIGFAVDMDSATKTIKFYKDGNLEYTYNLTSTMLTAIANHEMFPMIDTYSGVEANANFGQFAYQSTPPSGYKNLINYNLTNTTIDTSGTYYGSGLADGPTVFCNGVPTSITVDGGGKTISPSTYDKLAYGFKVRATHASATPNTRGTGYSWTIAGTIPFKNARGQVTPG